jgi:hypothetical protein
VRAHTADSNACDIQFVAWSNYAIETPSHYMTGEDGQTCGQQACAFEKISSIGIVHNIFL